MEPVQTSTPSIPPSGTAEPKNGSSMGIVLGLIIVVALIAVGAFYFWNDRMHDKAVQDKMLRELAEQSASTEASAIEADLSATTADDFDAELDAAFSELDAAFAEE